MDVSQVSAGSIVVGIDGSPWSDAALEWAIDQASLEQRALTVVHAIPSMAAQSTGRYAASGAQFVQVLDDARASARAVLAKAAARAHEKHPELTVHDVYSIADPRTTLTTLAERASLVVLGSRGRGPLASLLLGSVSVAVSMHAPCPVVVHRGDAAAQPVHRILVGVDGTEESAAAVEFAYRMASSRSSGLTVLHCPRAESAAALSGKDLQPDLGAGRALVAELVAGMAQRFPDVEATVHLGVGVPTEQLSAAARDHDLVVLGHPRVGQLRGLVHDSVALGVLEHSSGGVALVASPRCA